MIIDVHTHLWPEDKTPENLRSYFRGRNLNNDRSSVFTCEGILKSMDKAGIDKCVVSALSFQTGISNDDIMPFNDYVSEQVRKSQGRLAGFCTVDPFGGQKSVELLRKLIEDQGFKGLKLHGNMQQFFPDDPNLYGLYEQMQKYRLPILFHSGGIGVRPYKDKYGQPARFDEVACDFPELPIILGHAGRIWYEETAMLLRKHNNVYADISTNIGRLNDYKNKPMDDLLTIVKGWAGTTGHLFFGSDYPFYDQRETAQVILDMGKKEPEDRNLIITKEEIHSILCENTIAFCENMGIFN